MGRVAAIGSRVAVGGYGLVGVLVLPGEDGDTVLGSWAALPPDVEVVVLTAAAAAALGDLRGAADAPLTVVVPS